MTRLFQLFLTLVIVVTLTVWAYKSELGTNLKDDSTTTKGYVNQKITDAQTP